MADKKGFMAGMVESELVDIVGEEYVSTREADKLAYSVDSFWPPRMWVDRGCFPPQPDFIVHPANTGEVSRIVKLANYYNIPLKLQCLI